MNTAIDTVLTLDEAAAFLKAAPEVIQGLLETGELKGRQIAGEWRTTSRAAISYVDGVPLNGACCTSEDGTVTCCQPGQSGCC